MQVIERITTINESVQSDINLKTKQNKNKVVSNIQGIVLQTLQNNQNLFNAKGSFEEKEAKAKSVAETFFAIHITEEKLGHLNELPQRVKNVVSKVANQAGGELMAPANPMRAFLARMSVLTNQNNLINFFLTQSMGPAQQLFDKLESAYTDDVIDNFFS